MSRASKSADLPDDIVCTAEALVAAGRFASVEDVLRAGLDALSDEMDDDSDQGAVWHVYKARAPADPRDMTSEEVSACLGSDDPERQAALGAHLDVLVADLRDGRGMAGATTDMMADIRASLGLRQRVSTRGV